ncbi:MAG: hypothetical protein U1F41_04215 [Burkholderiales bacterium]
MLRSAALVVSAAAFAFGLAACATDSSRSTTASSGGNRILDDSNYRVGSRIPVKDPVSSSPTGNVNPSAMGQGAPTRTN